MKKTSTLDDVSTTTRPDQPNGGTAHGCPAWCTNDHAGDVEVAPGVLERWHFGGESGIELANPLGQCAPEVVYVELCQREVVDLVAGTRHQKTPEAAVLVGTGNPEAMVLADVEEMLRLSAYLRRSADLLAAALAGRVTDPGQAAT